MLRCRFDSQVSCKSGAVLYFDIRSPAAPLWRIEPATDHPTSSVTFRYIGAVLNVLFDTSAAGKPSCSPPLLELLEQKSKRKGSGTSPAPACPCASVQVQNVPLASTIERIPVAPIDAIDLKLDSPKKSMRTCIPELVCVPQRVMREQAREFSLLQGKHTRACR